MKKRCSGSLAGLSKSISDPCITHLTNTATLLVAMSALFSGSLIWPGLFSVPGNAAEIEPQSVLSAPRIRVVIPSLAEVESKLKFVIELSRDAHLQKQWKKLKRDIIDAYTDGVDEKNPLSVDLIFLANEMSYDYRIPVSDFSGEKNEFLEGLRGRSLKVHKLADSTYELIEKGKKPAHMRYNKNYAWIATSGRSVPTNPPEATSELKTILALKKDVVVEIKNDVEGMRLRRANFQALRTNWEGRTRIRRSETPNAFELRKVLQKAMLNEAERFLVEAQQVLADLLIDTSTSKGVARGEASLTALPGTDLFKSIQQFGIKPSDFANVTTHENSLVISRLCVPLDTIRIDHWKEFSKSLRPILETEIKTNPESQSDAQKRALIDAMNAILDMMEEGTQLRSVDTFLNLFASTSNKNTLVCAVRAADGKKVDEIIRLLHGFRSDWQVKFNAHDIAGVSIHELTVGMQDLATFQRVFDGERILYIGTSTKSAWAAAGAESLTHLKTAIQQSTIPAPEQIDPVVFRFQVRPDKLVSLYESLQKQDSSRTRPLTPEQKQTQKLVDKYFKLAHDSMSECDSSIQGELRRIDNKIEGSTEVNECTLRWIGAVLASLVSELE